MLEHMDKGVVPVFQINLLYLSVMSFNQAMKSFEFPKRKIGRAHV